MLGKQIIYSAVSLLMSTHHGIQNALAKQLYDPVASDVVVYTKLNFEKQVSKNRDKGISIVHFYKDEGKQIFACQMCSKHALVNHKSFNFSQLYLYRAI